MSRVWPWIEGMLEAVIGISLLAMTGVTILDVGGRFFFNAPLKGSYEISGMLMGLTVFATLPLAARGNSFMAVGLLTDKMRGVAKRVHGVVILIVSILAVAFIAWRMAIQAEILTRSEAASGSLQIPLAPLAWVMSGLAWLACAVGLLLMVRVLSGGEIVSRESGEPIE